DLPLEHGCLLWLRHILEAERETRGARRVFVQYNDLLSSPAQMAALIASQMTDETPARNEGGEREVLSLIDSKLRHHVAKPEELHHPEAFYPWLWDAYEACCALVNRPTGKEPQRRLDHVRAAFDVVAASFAPLLAARHRVLVELNLEIRALQNTLSKRDVEISALGSTLAERDAKMAKIDQSLTEHYQKLGSLRA